MTNNNPETREFIRKLLRLHGFASLVEEVLVKNSAALDADLSARAQEFPEEERHEFFEAHAEDYFELADQLPTILRYAVLTAADTAFEVYLNDTCAAYAAAHAVRVDVSDFGGSGVQRARKYLKKVAAIPFPDTSKAWQDVLRLHELRNSIVHADGVVVPSRTDLRQWSQSIDGLHITESGVISLSEDFTRAAVSAYEVFSFELDRACEQANLWLSVFPLEDDSSSSR